MLTLATAPTASAASAPDRGKPFRPGPYVAPAFGIAGPESSPAQRNYVTGTGGTRLFTETWLPAQRPGGPRPPRRLPTVFVLTPYAVVGELRYEQERILETLVPFGYAYTQVHVRGTGESGGCLEFISPTETEDAVHVIRWLAKDAPWTNGKLAGIGHSYDGGALIAAASSGERVVDRHLKAIVPLAPAASFYELGYFDGVPYAAADPGGSAALTALFSAPPGSQPSLATYLERVECQPEVFAGSLNPAGNFTDFARAREYKDDADRIRAATLMVHGHVDGANPPLIQAGLFDRLPRSTPKAGVFGVFWHEWPHARHTPIRTGWDRADLPMMIRAWFDRWVRGVPSKVSRWPVAQVQGSDGQWRIEPEWPRTGDPAAQLALDRAGELGTRAPSGFSAYREGGLETSSGLAPGTFLAFSTRPLDRRMELTGQPVLDLWLSVDRPDAHLAARIEALDRQGDPIPYASTTGFRSIQHLEPLRANRFAQETPAPTPVDTPLRVRVRFNPTDIVVPRGGAVRLVIAGSLSSVDPGMLITGEDLPAKDPSQPSGSHTEVTILHDCAHPSALRFTIPRRDRSLINVRESDEAAPLGRAPSARVRRTGGGVARQRICGRPPIRVAQFGRLRPPNR